jgi:S1-C subfamily serine protease
MTTISYAIRTAALVGALAPLGVAVAQVTAPTAPMPPDTPARRLPAPMIYFGTAADRGYLGITPRNSDGPADTLGLLVDDVESGLPAAKAGIARGSRLVSIDDVDLRLDPRDLGDSAAEMLPESRLRRALGRKKPGDTVALVVLSNGRKETKQVVLAESPMARTMRGFAQGRRVLGLNFSERGSTRDTAGLLIVGVTGGGAADKAGLVEGDRLVSIDGVDLRVSAADAGGSDGVQARVSRLRRALDAARDSQSVKLDVVTDGRRRTVSVTPTREPGWSISTDDFRGMADDIRRSVRTRIDDDDDDDDGNEMARDRAEAQREAARERAEAIREGAQARAEALREGQRARAEVQRELQRARREMSREMSRERDDVMDDSENDGRRVSGTMRGRTDGATMVLGGLTLAAVDRDFAQQFGRGSEAGALIVRIRGEWEPLKAGDVILSVDGKSVRDGTRLDVTLDRRRDEKVEILRNGKKEVITLPSTH